MSLRFQTPRTTRREFLGASVGAGGAVLLGGARGVPGQGPADDGRSADPPPRPSGDSMHLPNLDPARWIWYPSGRCLQNTFVLFRREINLAARPRRARGWISADSRYLLFVNGQRIQWGPPPCDPRWLEADPVDLTESLHAGVNVLGAQVLYFGVGDGTSPAGKPGFLFWLELEHADGRVELVVSDSSWRACLARAWQPGHYKRDYLRALQEVFDARRYPEGWNTAGFSIGDDWIAPMLLDNPPDKPPICASYPEYQFGFHAERGVVELRPRTIPLLREYPVAVQRLADSFWLRWLRPAEEF